MTRFGARPIAAGASVLVAIGLCIDAWRFAAADTIVIVSNETMESPAWRKSPPPLDKWLAVRNDLLRAEQLAPRSAAVFDSLGVLHARRAASPEFLAYARDYFARSLVLRPTSPYTWANYSEMKYLLGETGKGFEGALVNAGTLGPWEPEVQRLVVDVGLSAYDQVQPGTGRAIDSTLASGMRRNPDEFLSIAEKRDRLDVACRYVGGNPRVKNPKWIARCEGKNTK